MSVSYVSRSLQKLSFNHPSVVLTAGVFQSLYILIYIIYKYIYTRYIFTKSIGWSADVHLLSRLWSRNFAQAFQQGISMRITRGAFPVYIFTKWYFDTSGMSWCFFTLPCCHRHYEIATKHLRSPFCAQRTIRHSTTGRHCNHRIWSTNRAHIVRSKSSFSPSIDCGAFEVGSTRSEERRENRLGGRERKERAPREEGRVHVLGYLVFSPWGWGWWSESGLGIIFYLLNSGGRNINIFHTIYNSYRGTIYLCFRATLTRKLELQY